MDTCEANSNEPDFDALLGLRYSWMNLLVSLETGRVFATLGMRIHPTRDAVVRVLHEMFLRTAACPAGHLGLNDPRVREWFERAAEAWQRIPFNEVPAFQPIAMPYAEGRFVAVVFPFFIEDGLAKSAERWLETFRSSYQNISGIRLELAILPQ